MSHRDSGSRNCRVGGGRKYPSSVAICRFWLEATVALLMLRRRPNNMVSCVVARGAAVAAIPA